MLFNKNSIENIYIIIGGPIISTIVYCKIIKMNIIHCYWSPSYLVWMTITYGYLLNSFIIKNEKN